MSYFYTENEADQAIPAENLAAKLSTSFIEGNKLLENFLHRTKTQYTGRKTNFLYTLLFCFEIFLSDEALFSGFEVLN